MSEKSKNSFSVIPVPKLRDQESIKKNNTRILFTGMTRMVCFLDNSEKVKNLKQRGDLYEK